MRTFFRKKTQGVVLLSCLIFLLLMLTLLRFVLSSAQMGEFKAGADYDELTAKEAAMLVMRDAEMDIMRTDINGSHIDDNGSSTGIIDDEIKLMTKAVEYWLDDSKWSNRAGVFNGDAPPSGCNGPLYSCENIVKWNPSVACGQASNTVCYGSAGTGADMKTIKVDANGNITALENDAGHNAERGRYIIERFAGKGQVLGFTAGTDQKIVVLRVTAIGFSQPVAANAAANVAASSAMLQNTYVISKRDE